MLKKDRSLMEVKNHRRGIKEFIHDVAEFYYSRVDKNYILSEDSPEFLKCNRKLILKTIDKNPNYLDQVYSNILLEELQQPLLPVDGIIDTAFKKGYILDRFSSSVLLGKEAKTAILQYVKMQESNSLEDDFLEYNKPDSQKKLEEVLEHLDEELLLDTDFKEKLLDLAIQKDYRISKFSQDYLKQNSVLAENYYKNLLENSNVVETMEVLNSNILNKELVKNREFLQNYMKLLSQKGIDDEIIISTLIHDKECIQVFKEDKELFQVLFEQMTPVSLEDFFNNFFTPEEVDELLKNQDHLSGKLLQVSNLYAKDHTILQSLDGRLLGKRYQNIPNYKMQLIAKDSKFQKRMLGLSDYEYSLYSQMTELVSQKTDKWNRFEENIVTNLSDGYYKELVNDLHEQAKQGNNITQKEIETLIFLLSQTPTPKSAFDNTIMPSLKMSGMDEKAIEQEEILYSNNVFNITRKSELEHFEEIKELVCDTILTNPSLNDEQLRVPIEKYLGKFNPLPELDRMKLALLEKYYNIDLKEAASIVKGFSKDIDNIPVSDEYQTSIVEQIRAIKNIFESNDMVFYNKLVD